MKVILVTMQYDYGDISRGISGDYYFFEEPMKNMGIEVIQFDYMGLFKEKGKMEMNQMLLNRTIEEKPDIVFVVPFTDQFIPEVLDKIKTLTTSIVYYFDDVWRKDYSNYWSKHFTYATTSDINGIKKWSEEGCNNFVYSPFGANGNLYIKKNLPINYDVSFVGGYHPYRAWIFKKLEENGIKVNAFGYGWKNGKLSFEEMVNVFNQSRINLNLSNNESWDIRYIFSIKNGLKNNLLVIRNFIRSLIKKDAKTMEMIKARHFEINACGGFQLSYYTEGLEKNYEIGSEIAIYDSLEDLIYKIRYYLKNEGERSLIAQKGYLRAINNHTMEKRLSELFETIGFTI